MEDIINQVDELGNVVAGPSGTISFLRPAYDGTLKTHVYKRVPNNSNGQNILSNSSQVSYNALIFGEYIHYLPNQNGGQGLVDTSPYEVKTSITISRNLVVATYSPY